MVLQEQPKPVNPFGKPFPTKLALFIILLIVIVFFAVRWIREPNAIPPVVEEPQVVVNETKEPPENITTIPPEPAYTVQDLEVPEFPVLDRELANVA